MLPPIRSYAEFKEFLSEFTNYERVVSFRHDEETFALERVRVLARSLGNPHLASPCFHIAGTKGKGSTCLILESLLASAGSRIGTYTSPHIEQMRERIRVEGSPLSEEAIVLEANALLPVLEGRGRPGDSGFPTFFEFLTILAMTAFRRAGVDQAIHEVGLGGRLDATNIVEPMACAVTSIGLEHTQQLGNTLALIAREKAGILKPGVPVVLGRLPAEADEEIRRVAGERRAPIIDVDPGTVRRHGLDSLEIAGVDGPVPAGAIRGPALRANLALALRLAEAAKETLRPEAIRTALVNLRLPARVEVFATDPPVVLDGAHTADSIAALRATLEEIAFPAPRTLIFSIARGKDLPGILPQLSALADDFVWTEADTTRSVPPRELEAAMGRGRSVEDPCRALDEAAAMGRPIVITGSFYLAGRLRPVLRVRDRHGSGA
jgi:dihydrofolate synthase/folylpolyglutamate synthase